MFYSDTDSERASSIEDYQITCAEFITDISKDYADWVDRYNLDSKETDDRKKAPIYCPTIEAIPERISEYLSTFC